jgi:Flp pilus assembly protein TadB
MSNRPDDDRLARARQARQVLSGSDIRPPSPRTNVYAAANGMFTSSQRTYLISLGVLIVLGLLLWLVFSMGVASVIFFLLALTLIAGWLVF